MAHVDEASVRRAFEAVDKDHDGRLSSMEELRQAMRLLQIPFSASTMARFLEATGQSPIAAAGPKVTLNQFHAAVLTQQDRLRAAFSEMSGSADGRLTSLQARSFAAKLGVSLSHDEVQHLCQSIDRSERGHIQFVSACCNLAAAGWRARIMPIPSVTATCPPLVSALRHPLARSLARSIHVMYQLAGGVRVVFHDDPGPPPGWPV